LLWGLEDKAVARFLARRTNRIFLTDIAVFAMAGQQGNGPSLAGYRQRPSEEHAPMTAIRLLATIALMLGTAAPAASPTAAPVQAIDLVSFAYRPAPIVLRAGQPVTLMFVNRGKGTHDFTAPAFFGSARMLAGQAPRGAVVLRGQQSAKVTLIPAAGRYQVHCTRPFHKMMGMKTTIVVQ
jgi:plastocyanin